MSGVENDCSVDNFFVVRGRFVPLRFNVKAYALERQAKTDDVKNPLLFKWLCGWRREYCEDFNLPLYAMFSNQTLKDVAAYLPRNMKDLGRINGFGKVKIDRYGERCLEIVEKYCREFNIADSVPMDIFETPVNADKKPVKAEKPPKPEKVPTYDQTLQLLQEGLSIEEVAARRQLKESTVMGHLAVLVERGDVDAQDYVDGEILEFVIERFSENKELTLGDLFEELQQAVPYSLLRVAKAYFDLNNK